MSLRAKLLTLFLTVAVGPILALGAAGYAQSLRALEALLARQTADVADAVAAAVERQLARQESDVLLLGDNAETQRLLAAADVAARERARAQADTFLRGAWQLLGAEYRSLELRDVHGAVLYRLGDAPDDGGARGGVARTIPVQRAVRDAESGAPRGTLVVQASLDALLPREALERRVGERGYTVVLDRAAGRVLHHPRSAWTGQPVARLAAAEGWLADTAMLAAPRGTLRYGTGDSARVASFVSVAAPAWTVLAAAGRAEFSPPFEQARTLQLAVVLLVAASITAAFVQLLRRETRSLEALTLAADAVGRGNLEPALPAAGPDEVGRLSRAFDTMVGRVRDMITQVESGRQMAVLGEFASQIAHEIRNPLTAVKLNLQGLARDARAGDVPPASAASVEICLREIDRLEQVVRGVLDLAHNGPVRRERCALHRVAGEALRLVGDQAATRRVTVQAELRAGRDAVDGDAARLQGAVLELLLNALAAMPDGGRLRVWTDTADDGATIRLHVRDSGPGVPADARERIFRPFHTTRPDGTGLGLPIARRTAEAHGGTLVVAASVADADDGPGAEFVLALPLAPHATAAGAAPLDPEDA